MNDYGKRNGSSPTAGKKAEIISDVHGRHHKRVFKGQRLLVISQLDEGAKLNVDAQSTQKRADADVSAYLDAGYMVAYSVEAQPVA